MRSSTNPARIAFASFALLVGSVGPQVLGQTTAAKAKVEPENPGEFTRVPGLFDVDLPKTVEKFKAKLIVHPHFGDLLHRDYLRVPVGVRLGVSDHTEINAELESYLTHGLKKQGAGYGLYSLSLGAKHAWRKWLKPDVDTSTGFNARFPVGRPPLDLTDGYYHFAPYVSFTKRWRDYPKLTPFVTFGTDLMWKSPVPGSFDKNQPHSDTMGISAGCLYDLNTLKYTLVCSYWTTALIGQGNRQLVSVNPSVLWQLPPVLTFHSQGRWIFGVGLRANFGPDGTSFGGSGKLRGEFRFSRFFRASPAQSEK